MIVSMKINNSTIKKKKKLKYSLLQQQFICTWYLMELWSCVYIVPRKVHKPNILI